MRAVLDHTEPVAHNIVTFWFKSERPLRYDAGQYTELYLPHENPDNRGQKRWFTLSSSPIEPLLSITTKFAPEHGSTFKAFLHELKPGTEVMLADPMGDFVLPKDVNRPIVYVAGGIGVTPMRSMIKSMTDRNEKRDIHLLYSVSRADELAFRDLFTAYAGNNFIPIAKEAETGWVGETGPLTVERILQAASNPKETLFYLSGPEPMIEAFAKGLKDAGVNKHQIVTDFFPGYPAV